MTRSIAGVVLVCVVLAAGIFWWAAPGERWSVLLITLDTTRADHLGCYGKSAALTPNIDRVAAQGTLFERAYTVVPITLPAHATMLTGLLPPEHGLRINGTSRLPDAVPTLAETLRQDEYRTAAFVSSLVLDERFGLGRGFEHFDDELGAGPDGPQVERSASETVSAAIAWIDAVVADPFFCWVHLYDPHEPYEQHPREFGDQFEGRPYDAEIAYMDLHVGRLLDLLQRLEIDDRTLVIIAGDHGEGLGEHGEPTHGYLAYNSTMHVPLIIRRPVGEQPGTRVAEPTSLVDLFPTILDVLGRDVPSDLHGRSLVARGDASDPGDRPCYGETEAPLMEGGWCPLRTWTTDRWKYIQSTQPELYDLAADPHETLNRLADHPDEAARLAEQLASFESKLRPREGSNAVLSEQEQRALASLGYTGGHVVAQQNDQPRRDIKETLRYAEQVHECMHRIDRSELTEARQILEGVVEALPDYSKAWGTLGVCLARLEDYPAAERSFRRALELDTKQNFARIGLGRMLFAQDRFEECIEELEAAVAAEPTALDAQYYLAEACRKLGRWDRARAAYKAALTISPGFAPAETGLADLDRDQTRSTPAR